MWIASKFGWFSIVRKDDGFHVRARVREDLRALMEACGLSGEVELREWDGSDYRYRIIIDKVALDRVMATLADELDYPNFKGVIGGLPGQRDKLHAYHAIWETMSKLQDVQPWQSRW
jgi:hypothetical protein